MGSCCKNDTATVVTVVISSLLAVGAIVVSAIALKNSPKEVDCSLTCARTERLEEVKKQLANLTDKVKMEGEDSNRTTSKLIKQVQQLKHDYMELLNETKALNQTINYTTSATVQRALNELKDVKETQSAIQKKLKALSHLDNTTKDYLNLVESVTDLTTQMNQNITRLEEKIEDNRQEWGTALDANISTLKTRFERKFEEIQNKRNNTNGAGVLFYTLVLLTTLDSVIIHV